MESLQQEAAVARQEEALKKTEMWAKHPYKAAMEQKAEFEKEEKAKLAEQRAAAKRVKQQRLAAMTAINKKMHQKSAAADMEAYFKSRGLTVEKDDKKTK